MADSHSTLTHKRCTRCGETKHIEEFAKEGDKRRNQCKACRAAMLRDRRAKASPEQKEQHRANCRAYSAQNRERLLVQKREYHAANAQARSKKNKQRYESDPVYREAAIARAAKWRKANAELNAKRNKKWAAENKDKMASYFRASKDKRRSNPLHRMYEAVGAQLRNALSGRKDGRKWESLVGYTRADLVAHLERQFLAGMSWANYGIAWHIDHIVPQVEFEVSHVDGASIKACWALTNLRPLWAKENAGKGGKRTHLL